MSEEQVKGIKIIVSLVEAANLSEEEKFLVRLALAYRCDNGSLILPNLD